MLTVLAALAFWGGGPALNSIALLKGSKDRVTLADNVRRDLLARRRRGLGCLTERLVGASEGRAVDGETVADVDRLGRHDLCGRALVLRRNLCGYDIRR